MSHTNSAEEILTFWFSEPVKRLWYSYNPAFERLLRVNYLHLYHAACKHALDSWCLNAEGSLAVTIILDQFPLHMFPGEEEAFINNDNIKTLAKNAILKGQDNELENNQKGFLYMPFVHSESLEDQLYAIKLFEEAGLEDGLEYAKKHHDLIQRFGRFPQRNKVLGRISSKEEREYLKSDDVVLC